jgi:biotin operon repressor
MTTEEQQVLALKTLHEAIQALKDCGLMIEEEEE